MANLVFAENERAAQEGNYDAAASDGGDKGKQRILVAERLEVGDIGNRQEKPDKGDTPSPLKRRVFCAVRPPEHKQRKAQNGNHINHKPDLYADGGNAEGVDEIFIEKAAARAKEDREKRRMTHLLV